MFFFHVLFSFWNSSDCKDDSAKRAAPDLSKETITFQAALMLAFGCANMSRPRMLAFSVCDRWFWKFDELQPLITTKYFGSHRTHIISLLIQAFVPPSTVRFAPVM